MAKSPQLQPRHETSLPLDTPHILEELLEIKEKYYAKSIRAEPKRLKTCASS